MRRTVETSSFYQGWLDSVEGDLYQLKQAIKTKDFQLLGETMERNGLKMHGTTLAAQPPFTYWSPDSKSDGCGAAIEKARHSMLLYDGCWP